jgi:hypothetical protein
MTANAAVNAREPLRNAVVAFSLLAPNLNAIG